MNVGSKAMSILAGWFPAYFPPPESAVVVTYSSYEPGLRLAYYQSHYWWNLWHLRVDVTAWTWPANSKNGKFLEIQDHSLAAYYLSLIIKNYEHILKLRGE